MPNFGHHVLTAAVFFLAASASGDNSASDGSIVTTPISTTSALTSSIVAAAVTSLPSVLTCRSKTINYITHTLPQQCLRANWTASANVSSVHATTTDAQSVRPATETATGTAVLLNETAVTSVGKEGQQSEGSGQGPFAQSEAIVSTTVTTSTDPAFSELPVAALPVPSPSATENTIADEADSPLDTANFLSFEEWKKQSLAKSGQSPENVGQGKHAPPEARKRPGGINNALDALGDDVEIELDFSGFGRASSKDQEPPMVSGHETASAAGVQNVEQTPGTEARGRSKDAGVTYKERFNYASFDCAATVVKTNPKCKSSSSILVESKDSYMLNECSSNNKFLVVELCEEILIDTVVVANFEFFSSTFRTFRVSVSDRYPVKADRWKELGTFEARNSRDIQAFLVENPLIWARYLRIEFLTHYGNEYYCPVSLLRIHGTTMMEEFRHQEDNSRGEDIDDAPVIEPEVSVIKPITTAAPSIEESTEIPVSRASSSSPVATEAASTPTATLPEVILGVTATSDTPSQLLATDVGSRKELIESIESPQSIINTFEMSQAEMSASTVASISGKPTLVADAISDGSLFATSGSDDGVSHGQAPSSGIRRGDGIPESATSSNIPMQRNATAEVAGSHSSSTSAGTAAWSISDNGSSVTSAVSNHTSSADSSDAAQPTASQNKTGSAVVSAPNGRNAPSAALPPAPSPSTQESFFKSVHKRLQMLEANATLSLQYIEEQSRILRDAFVKVEKRQLAKTEDFLRHLNNTVVAELNGFRQQYDQLWQSTVIELESHRENHQREMLAIGSRLTILADELVFQKRMAVVQSTLLLICLGLVLFVRSGTSHLELPLLQQIMNRSQTWPSSRSPSRQAPFRPGSPSSDDVSEGSVAIEATISKCRRSPAFAVEAATPISPTADTVESDTYADSPAARFSPRDRLRQTHSGPATPTGSRDRSRSGSWEDVERLERDSSPKTGSRSAERRKRTTALQNGELT